MDTNRYTTDQVLAGIQSFVREHVDNRLELDPEASVCDYREAVVESHECPLSFFSELAHYFGLRCGARRWSVWLKLPRTRRRDTLSKRQLRQIWSTWEERVGRKITVRALAEYLAKRAPGVSMSPATLLGQRCEPAGVFLGLAALPEVRGRAIAPSTPMKSILGCEAIRQLWTRAAWVSGASLPELPATRWWLLRSHADWVDAITLGAAALSQFLFFFTAKQATGSLIVGLVAAIVGVATILLAGALLSNRLRNPLPEGIETFGDLARLVSASRRADLA